MRPIIPVLFLLLSSLARCGDCKEQARIATTFMNQYVTFRDTSVRSGKSMDVVAWLKSNSLVTEKYISGYQAEEAKGLAQDPELGWDSDVILDSQDYPDKGFKLLRCLDQDGYVVLQGVDWPEFLVTVRLVTTKGGVKVVGSGVINIPKHLQAKHD